MLKKTVTYVDFNGLERTEDFYFNLTKSELLQWEYSVEGGLAEILDKIVKSKEASKLIGYFKEIVLKAYGRKSDDGRRFEKSDAISEEFSQTPAYDEIYMELFMDEDAASAFIKGILPDGFNDDFEKSLSELEKSRELPKGNSVE